jgi:hypothetical protein
MKGYTALNQFILDYRLYQTAKKIDPGKEGKTVTSLMNQRIDYRLKFASKNFKFMLSKRKYSFNDLKFIATHDYMKEIYSIEMFFTECFGTQYVTSEQYKTLLKSSSFKSGRLKRLYEFIPQNIISKNDFLRMLRFSKRIRKNELTTIMNSLCNRDWRIWYNELLDQAKIMEERGMVFT